MRSTATGQWPPASSAAASSPGTATIGATRSSAGGNSLPAAASVRSAVTGRPSAVDAGHRRHPLAAPIVLGLGARHAGALAHDGDGERATAAADATAIDDASRTGTTPKRNPHHAAPTASTPYTPRSNQP